jgi:hypothetical protein
LRALRLLALRARRAWVHRLSLDELQYPMRNHAGCAGKKKRLFARPRQPHPAERDRRAQPAANAG